MLKFMKGVCLMKVILILFLVVFVFSGCNSNVNNKPTDINITELTTEINNHDFDTNELLIGDTIAGNCNKDCVSEFMTALNSLELENDFSTEFKEENCYNVTPESVSEVTDFKIFKFSDTCASFVFIDNEVFGICNSFGGYGFVNAVPWDYDNDGNIDLLVASSWGSGVHRSEISVFNTKTKEYIAIYNNMSSYINPCSDLFVADDFKVYSCNINGNNYANLSVTPYDFIGTVSNINGIPVFVSSNEKLSSFSYDNFLSIYKDDCGFVSSGFLNIEKVVVTNIDQVIELAEKECTVEYDGINVLYDSKNKIYCVSFGKEDYCGGNQDILINKDGVTQFIYYGE